MSSRRIIAQIAALVLVLSISACARPVGDFGRAVPDDPLRAAAASAGRGIRTFVLPASRFNLADQEVEMRDRVWRYMVSPEDYDWFGDSLAEIERVGFGSPWLNSASVKRYYQWLHGMSFASSPVRYTRLSDDIKADLGTMPAVFRSICAVKGIDRQRAIAANGVPGIEDDVRAGVAGRHAENEAMIGWFTQAVAARYHSYSYALDHLLVETPHDQAMSVDADLTELEIYVAAANSDDFCTQAGARSSTGGGGGSGARYQHSQVAGKGS